MPRVRFEKMPGYVSKYLVYRGERWIGTVTGVYRGGRDPFVWTAEPGPRSGYTFQADTRQAAARQLLNRRTECPTP